MSTNQSTIFLGKNVDGSAISLHLPLANRHGLIAGATGTGKTVTLQLMAESFSACGVPVFTADIKGDLSGLAQAGSETTKVKERRELLKLGPYQPLASPVLFWDVLGKNGHPVRTTIAEIGPVLLGRLLGVNNTQQTLLSVAFKFAEEENLPLLDAEDLRTVLNWLDEHAKELDDEFGNIPTKSISTIQRNLFALTSSGGEGLFGEPALKIEHLMQKDFSGRGVISILDARELFNSPQTYSTLLLWLLSEIYENLPEVGDLEKPKLVFFFDEAHLLFKDTPKPLVDKIEQVVRLVRSKGVGVYFITQNPNDIPESILGQLGNRVQHALRAFTPNDQRAIRAAANTFCVNSKLKTEEIITQLGVGEALVSTLDAQGRPTPVEHTLICPPNSRIGPLTDSERAEVISRSPLKGIYDSAINRESAHEILQKRILAKEEVTSESQPPGPFRQSSGKGLGDAFMKSLVRTVANQVGREVSRSGGRIAGGLVRDVLKSIFSGR